MATNTHSHKQTNWMAWGGGALAVVVVIAAAVWGFDLFGTGTEDAVAPAVEQSQ